MPFSGNFGLFSWKIQKYYLKTKENDSVLARMTKNINAMLMTMIAGCALPFALVASGFFIKFVASLNSKYASKYMKSPRQLSQTLLPKLYEHTQQEVLTLWKKKRAYYRTFT